ncbi:uncharacterized protein LOC107776409 [Nicotiana tabacum]|uniref:Uncharacterized protein LOC107776409 n=1 Tax=Nicotiana tabacum TaxID=4097 RepID=A0AC58S2E5_TOBAC
MIVRGLCFSTSAGFSLEELSYHICYFCLNDLDPRWAGKAWLLDKMPQDVLAACIGKSTEKFQSVVLAYHAIGDRGNSACQISRSQAWTEERRCQVCYRNYAAAR